jgi:hypothetical protein
MKSTRIMIILPELRASESVIKLIYRPCGMLGTIREALPADTTDTRVCTTYRENPALLPLMVTQ